MALLQNIESATGITHENAYIRIDEYACLSNNIVNARVRAYISREAHQDGKQAIEGTEEIITLIGDYKENAKNMKYQIYENMKALEKYEGAVDVLED